MYEPSPLALFRSDELRNEDVSLRLNSVRRLRTIALALGEERTRRELIPFLNDNCEEDDEVLLALAEELGSFVSLVGGPSHAHVLLPPLEVLAGVDETVVRDRAVSSLATVADSMHPAARAQALPPLVLRLSERDWTARVSATGLFAAAFPSAEASAQQQLVASFLKLCRDETPMVRRAAAQHL
ncbi:hypothetical protein H632_c523p2, partial [Helicosporidium sp. ATCC 50920]